MLFIYFFFCEIKGSFLHRSCLCSGYVLQQICNELSFSGVCIIHSPDFPFGLRVGMPDGKNSIMHQDKGQYQAQLQNVLTNNVSKLICMKATEFLGAQSTLINFFFTYISTGNF